MKGQIEIVVGTTKDPEEVLMMRRMSLLQVEDDLSPINPRSRSGSIASRLSDSSVMTTGTLPPPYSQLSSRAVSMLSLETRKFITKTGSFEHSFIRIFHFSASSLRRTSLKGTLFSSQSSSSINLNVTDMLHSNNLLIYHLPPL